MLLMEPREVLLKRIYELRSDNAKLKANLALYRPSHLFVEHIRDHLKTMNTGDQVICKICGKTIDEIATSDKGE